MEWVKKKTGPSVITITSKDDAELIVDTQKTTMAIAYLEDLKVWTSGQFYYFLCISSNSSNYPCLT